MNANSKQTDKATVRPRNNRNTRTARLFEGVARDRARLAQLETEHAALVAVADCAAYVASQTPIMPNHQSALQNALANLAAVRGESEGAK